VLGRVDEFFEVHRWEPGVIGKPQTQKPWFTPEYVQWLKTVPPRVWVADPAAQKDIGYPRAMELPWQDLVKKYGHYCWTSTVSYMTAMAIDKIQAARAAGDNSPHTIGFWGVDMAANEELYSNQRSAAQFFIQILVGLNIEFYIPPESDLATPPAMYGVSEVFHKSIKLLQRKRELERGSPSSSRRPKGNKQGALFCKGALDDMAYHLTMWNFGEDVDTAAVDFPTIFPEIERVRQLQNLSAEVKNEVAQALDIVEKRKLKKKASAKPPVVKKKAKKRRR
jgi:hypothetical protein